MDYSGFTGFPFPAGLNLEDEEAKSFFMDLPDEVQMGILRECQSYDEFVGKVKSEMKKD